MIELFVGTPGSGKSYHALTRALFHVRRRNCWVVANFPVTNPPERWIYKPEWTVQELVQMSHEKGWYGHEGRCLLVLDEAGVLFNARDWQLQGKKRLEWIMFFSQHRKLGYDVILIAQDDRMVDRQIRAQVEVLVKHVRASRLPVLKWIRWPVFLVVTYPYHVRMRGSIGALILLPWVARRYDSMRMFGELAGYGRGAGRAGLGAPAAAAPAAHKGISSE